ncbi:DUF4239 domain-containing protein [Mycolicibacterium sp. S2-37]|uniref:bestrophin-like domain n=1 Tax=Mycolicibacterium sp. S2-37 TaxID=2810297 RepID=UPI001A9500DC|nr:DUF4239 domain-containing protein [Mycolicibacterium sp. S2-37]MBO0681279.1 DUF4239 domain-containing protein [Mycolicibacterium sp. S2-37]
MIWLLQQPPIIVAPVVVIVTVALSVFGLIAFRRLTRSERFESANDVTAQTFALAGILYAVLVAFVVVVVWEQFEDATAATESEANAISDLLRDSETLPPQSREAVRRSLIAYAEDVVNDEFVRLHHGEAIEQQSDELTAIWQSYLDVQPVTQIQIAFLNEDISKLNDLGSSRKVRISSSHSGIPTELWVLLVGGGAVMLLFTYLFGTAHLAVHACSVALAGALLSFVLYLIFALEHPFVGDLSVQTYPYEHVLEAWRDG